MHCVDYTCTIFPGIDAAATIHFIVHFGAAFIRGWPLFEGGVYFAQNIRWCGSIRWCCPDSDEEYPFLGLEEDEDELEYTETVLEDC